MKTHSRTNLNGGWSGAVKPFRSLPFPFPLPLWPPLSLPLFLPSLLPLKHFWGAMVKKEVSWAGKATRTPGRNWHFAGMEKISTEEVSRFSSKNETSSGSVALAGESANVSESGSGGTSSGGQVSACAGWGLNRKVIFFFCRARLKLRRSSILLFRLSIPTYENISETDIKVSPKNEPKKQQQNPTPPQQKPKANRTPSEKSETLRFQKSPHASQYCSAMK